MNGNRGVRTSSISQFSAPKKYNDGNNSIIPLVTNNRLDFFHKPKTNNSNPNPTNSQKVKLIQLKFRIFIFST